MEFGVLQHLHFLDWVQAPARLSLQENQRTYPPPTQKTEFFHQKSNVNPQENHKFCIFSELSNNFS